jgi:uncharacterized protein (DUF433 family)
MDAAELRERISIDPAICGGKACIRGHRIWVSLVLGTLADGMTVQEILDNYPQLEETDVRACVAYGAQLADTRFVDLADPAA